MPLLDMYILASILMNAGINRGMLLLDIYTSIHTDERRHKQGVLIIPSHKSTKTSAKNNNPKPKLWRTNYKLFSFLFYSKTQNCGTFCSHNNFQTKHAVYCSKKRTNCWKNQPTNQTKTTTPILAVSIT